jgi:hypothetical protein
MKIPIREALISAGRRAWRDPALLGRMAKHAAGLGIPIPLDALRWLATHLLTGEKAPVDVEIAARPPALWLAATLSVLSQKLRFSCLVRVERIEAAPDVLLVTLRLHDLQIRSLSPMSPLDLLLQSGALDVARPATLLNFLGANRPKVIASAQDNEFVLDLLQIPAVARNRNVRTTLRVLTPVLTVDRIFTEGDFLILGLKTMPAGLKVSLANLRG